MRTESRVGLLVPGAPTPVLARPGLRLKGLLDLLPRGTTLPDAAWWPRHRAILVLLWFHAAAVPTFALLRGYSPAHAVLESSPIVAAAIVATSARVRRRVRVGAATVGLLTSSAVLVHLSGGVIEMHFHFFVMVPVIALYQDWSPFLVAIGYVLIHHGLMGAIAPESVYNHFAAQANPWKWASIHAGFIAGISVVCLVTWRLNELALAMRERADESLREALSLLTATLEATADGILVVNASGRITSANQKFLEMWNIPAELAATRDDEVLLAFVLDQLTDPEAFLAKVRELYDSEEESFDELGFKDGRVFERYSQPQWIGRRSTGRVWSFRDITSRKEAEQAVNEAALRDREAVERLEALDRSKNLFLTAVSHELRTPLTSVIGFARLLNERGDRLSPPDRVDLLSRLTSNAERLQQLVLNVFDLDRMSRGIVSPLRRRVDLGSLAASVLEQMDFAGRAVDLALSPAEIDVDPGMAERVVENLVANALKHTPVGASITVHVSPAPEGALLVVEDSGPGIPDDLKEAVFSPFVQGVTPSHSPGTGIGLSLVDQFAKLHGGRAWVEDREGGGSRFSVLFPNEAAQSVP